MRRLSIPTISTYLPKKVYYREREGERGREGGREGGRESG
jgi:hypothetical protein